LTGAAGAALYLPQSPGGGVEARILHVGALPVIPELRDLEVAGRFCSDAADRLEELRSAGRGDRVLVLPSELPTGRLLPVHHPATRVSEATRRRRSDHQLEPPVAWLGLRLHDVGAGSPGAGRLHELLENLDTDPASGLGHWLIGLGGAIAAYHLRMSGLIGDSVAGLPGRAELQSFLSEEIATALVKRHGLTICFINPDDFGAVNENFGREAGDRVMREIAERLLAVRRRGDLVARFGGAIFASVLIDTPLESAFELGERFRLGLTHQPYLDGAVRLGFSVGVACLDPEGGPSPEALGLIRRADQALGAAKRAGGDVVTIWSKSSEVEQAENLDRLTGVFTGNMAKDYRNMVLLWNVLGVIARRSEPDALADEVIATLFSTIKPERIVLLVSLDDGELEPVSVAQRNSKNERAANLAHRVRLSDEVRRLISETVEKRHPVHRAIAGQPEGGDVAVCVVPLHLEETRLGCLCLEGPPESFSLDDSDLVFLQALAAQLAVALDRARLAEQGRRRQAEEQRRLRAELNDLRSAIKQARLVYQSPQMESLLTTTRRVARTEATVLITGESGTGKELLARTLHELSHRQEGPFEIVDCGSIAPTLIESELFGHERGAYTGAQKRSQGRLARAQQGTVLLDEVSELPLEVQSRLLRFVQEKELTTVGGTRPRRLDVRIIAATNRNLESEVAAGRFREDLFYRLNVVRLLLPPLRERPDDILLLARHYLESFALTFQKPVRRISPEAEAMLMAQPWPGNVRELQNRILQAVVMCDGEELGPQHFDTVDRESLPTPPPLRSSTQAGRREPGVADRGAEPAEASVGDGTANVDRAWQDLRTLLARHVDAAISSGRAAAHPIGTWLAEDLILAAHQAADGIVRQAASRIGMAETTFGRRLRNALTKTAAGLCDRPESWDPVRAALVRVIDADDGAEDDDLLCRSQRVLMEEIVHRVPEDTTVGSALLGVTPPTYRRRLADLTG